MTHNVKFTQKVRRRDEAQRRKYLTAALVLPKATPATSWWTTAGREAFTQTAAQQTKRSV